MTEVASVMNMDAMLFKGRYGSVAARTGRNFWLHAARNGVARYQRRLRKRRFSFRLPRGELRRRGCARQSGASGAESLLNSAESGHGASSGPLSLRVDTRRRHEARTLTF